MIRYAFAAALFVLPATAHAAPADQPLTTNHETCVAACNHDFATCMDEPSNEREALPGTGPTPSSGATCRADLGPCLDRCRGV